MADGPHALLSTPFWLLLAGGAVAVALLWWALLSAPRRARRLALERRIGTMDPPGSDSALAALQGMRRSIADAYDAALRPRGRPTRRSQLYRIPWVLFVGDAGADVPGLLATAYRASRQPPPQAREPIGDSFWRWWLLGPLVAIETHADAVCDDEARRERGLWFQALRELVLLRPRLPLNGIVVCVGAAALLAGGPALRETAARLRRLADEATQLLRVRLPLYLVVTGLERWPGQGVVGRALPPTAHRQALGHRFAAAPAPDLPQFEAVFEQFVQRLDALCMGLWLTHHRSAERLALLRYMQQVQGLAPGLRMVAEILLDTRADPGGLWLRGFYVAAASTEEEDGSFVTELFQQLLPVDQPLARPRG